MPSGPRLQSKASEKPTSHAGGRAQAAGPLPECLSLFIHVHLVTAGLGTLHQEGVSLGQACIQGHHRESMADQQLLRPSSPFIFS